MWCRDPSLGFATKTKACKGAGQKWNRESHFMLLRVWESVREWTPTLPSELPLGELESRWTPKFSKSNCKGQNPLNRRIPYIIEKLLESRCLKWARMTHLGSWNIRYDPKEGPRVKLAIWLQTTKNQESLQCPYVQVACYIPLERSWLRLQLCLKPHFNHRSIDKIIGFQSGKSSNFGNFRTLTWEFRVKMTFGCWPHGQAQSIL
jgi:hypothetical protein